MGLKLVLPNTVFTDATLPKLEIDPILTTGSLLLVDFANPAGYTGNTLPVNNQVINNIAWEKALQTIGSGTQTTLSSTFEISGLVGTESSKHKYEFSSKKGLHGIISQNPGIVSGDKFRIMIPQIIQDYLFDNIGVNGSLLKSFYFSVWFNVTRLGSGTSAILDVGASSTSGSTNNILAIQSGGLPSSNGNLGKRSVGFNSSLGAKFMNSASNLYTGTKTTHGSSRDNFNWGSSGAWQSFETTINPSITFYKMYIEDLTASGRTYAEVDALDYALYTEAFSVGGRFYNDTNTNPTTIA